MKRATEKGTYVYVSLTWDEIRTVAPNAYYDKERGVAVFGANEQEARLARERVLALGMNKLAREGYNGDLA